MGRDGRGGRHEGRSGHTEALEQLRDSKQPGGRGTDSGRKVTKDQVRAGLKQNCGAPGMP